MLTVPYQPVPSVKPTDTGIGGISVNAPAGAFGADVGHALEGLGKVEQHIGDEMWQRAKALQELQNDTEAKEADAAYMERTAKLHAEFNSLQGAAAGPKALEGYTQGLKAARDEIGNGISNPAARKIYDAASLSFMGRNIFNGAGHSATQMKVAAGQASSARVDMMLNQAAMTPEDDIAFQRVLRGVEGEVHQQGDIAGWLPDQRKDQVIKQTSAAWAYRIIGLSKTKPYEAQTMLDENKDKLHFNDLRRVEDIVSTKTNTVGARNIADSVLAPLYDRDEKKPEKSSNQFVDEGLKSAKEKFPNNDQLPDYVEKEVISKYNRFRAGQREFDYNNRNTIYSSLEGVGGKIPSTLDELLSDPKASQAYDQLDAKGKAWARNAVLVASRKGTQYDPATSAATRDRLTGMAKNNGNEFLDTNLFVEKLNTADRNALLSLRRKMTATPGSDPHLEKAMSILRASRGPEMQSLRIYRRADNKDGYDSFTGALAQGIETYMEQNKRPPKPEEILAMGDQLMYKPKAEGVWQSIFGTNTRFEEPVPEAWSDQFKALAKQRDPNRVISDDEIKRAYWRSQFRDFHSKPKPSTSAKPGKAPEPQWGTEE